MGNATKGNGILVGSIIGGAIGAVCALLLAPKSGVELRKDIADRYQTFNDKTQEIASNVGQRTQEIASNVGQKSQAFVRNVSDQATEIVDKAKDIKDIAVESWRDAKITTLASNENHSNENKTNNNNPSSS